VSAPRFHCSVAEVMHGTTTFPSLRAGLGVGAPAALLRPLDDAAIRWRPLTIDKGAVTDFLCFR